MRLRWRIATRRMSIGLLLALVLLGPAPESSPQQEQSLPVPARSLNDPRLSRLRRASAGWMLQTGPRRAVVDQVCLVPDVPTFLRAIASWDDRHYFPVLIEDAEYTLKFLRAFRPARIVRYPDRAGFVGGDRLWRSAVEAVGRSWTADEDDPSKVPPGDQRPETLRSTPPGLVISNSDAPMLAGAVALAAGRFQPLIAWEPGRGFGDDLSTAEADRLARDLQHRVAAVVPDSQEFGDDCDFLTLALDYPYFYEGKDVAVQAGPAAFDDLIGRNLDVPRNAVRPRWAYTGRLLGDPTRSVYRAMCSLFLRPDSAVLFNNYVEGGGRPHGDYRVGPAADRLEDAGLTVEQRIDDHANLAGWHGVFDPVNRAGLVFINSSGGSTGFSLGGSYAGRTEDIPISVPTAVHMVHSHSAANPTDPNTLAGRWLANGAYLYYGSANEPYLTSFRTPTLVSDLLMEGLPFVAAARLLPEELPPFANAWRLTYVGDPLYRIDLDDPPRRLQRWSPVNSWPVYKVPEPPADDADAFARLSWAVKAALEAARRGEPPPRAVAETLLKTDRRGIDSSLREIRDVLLADTLFQLDALDALRADLGRWPASTLSPDARRWLQAARVVQFHRALADDDWDRVTTLWTEVARSGPSRDFFGELTRRAAPPMSQADRVRSWETLLRSLQNTIGDHGPARVVEEELKRIEAARSSSNSP